MWWAMFEDRLEDLLASWRTHHDLRRGDAPVERLAAARIRLDEARTRANAVRRAFAPEVAELEETAGMIYCEQFEESVFVYRTEGRRDDAGVLHRCICGRQVDLSRGDADHERQGG